MKLFYCPENDGYCEYLVVMAENVDDCEEKIKTFHGDDDEYDEEYTREFISNVLANKKNWEEIESGMFNGEWD